MTPPGLRPDPARPGSPDRRRGAPRVRSATSRPVTEAYYASRTLKALELLSFQDLSCPQLAATMQVHPRTARRLLVRLAADGYIEQTQDSRRRYHATLRLAALGAQLIAHTPLPRIAAPILAELSEGTGATACLFIPAYRHVACVLHCEHSPQREGPVVPMLREQLPAHASAPGRVLLAHRQPWRDSILTTRLPDTTAATRAELELDAADVRERGYVIDDGDTHPDALSIAAPVLTGHDAPAAIAITTTRPGSPGGDAALREQVTNAAAALAKALTDANEQRRTRGR